MASLRKINPELLNAPWYLDMPGEYQFFYIHLILLADEGGLLHPPHRAFKNDTGMKINPADFLEYVNADRRPGELKRVVELPNGKWFLTAFFKYQISNDSFSPGSGNHKGALKKWIPNNIHPYDVLGDLAHHVKELTLTDLADIAFPRSNGEPHPDRPRQRVNLTVPNNSENNVEKINSLNINDITLVPHRSPTDDPHVQHLWGTVDPLEREYVKGNKDLGVSIGETSIAHEEEIIISPNTTSLSQKKSSKKNPENSGAKKRGRPRKNPVPLIAETPELVTGSGESISPKPASKAKRVEDNPLVMPFDSDEFMGDWTKWRTYLKQRHKAYKERYPYDVPMTEQEALNNLKLISGGNEQFARECISFSISKGWKSICKPNQQQVPHGATATANGTNNFDPLAAIGSGFSGVFSSPAFTASPGRAVRERGATIDDLQALKRNRGTNTGS